MITIISISDLLECKEQTDLPASSLLANNNDNNSSKYELKFQIEVGNSTIRKRPNQQQIFKCQVKLTQAKRIQHNRQLLSNVSLTVDWFKNDQNLTDIYINHINMSNSDLSSLSIINVELTKSNNNSGLTNNDKKNSKPVAKRIEIKNTLNFNQLKLTSRLKLNHLNESDSGQYKCIASASYKFKPQQAYDNDNNINNINGDFRHQQKQQSEESYQKFSTSSSSFTEQRTIESNEAILLVSNNNCKYKVNINKV